jgi:hypothetical protein
MTMNMKHMGAAAVKAWASMDACTAQPNLKPDERKLLAQ